MDDFSSSFKQRLSYLERLAPKKFLEKKGKGVKSSPGINSLVVDLPGSWKKAGEYTYIKREILDNPITVDDYSFCPLIPSHTTPGDLLFFDLETTGLSGGAGNICFLIGIGEITAGGFEIIQVFLSDFPGEEEFLRTISSYFQREKLFVSYNGKSFDSHLIRTRCVMNRMKCDIEKQFDLLHISRRLFKQVIGSCSLGNIEEKVLSIYRNNDVSGFEVPDIYFDFLKTRGTGDLLRVFDHNFQDILSLAHLFQYILSLFSPASLSGDCRVDKGSLGQVFLDYGDQRGISLLTEAFENGDARAGKNISLYYKRQNQWDRAVDIWKVMAGKVKSIFATLELAKYYEHREKDYEKALAWVEKVFDFHLPLSFPDRMELLRRKDRLMRKLGKGEGPG